MPNDDYILRGDALKAIRYENWREGNRVPSIEELHLTEYQLLAKAINDIHAADVEPKRKTGRWIIAGAFDDFYQCPECGNMWPIFSTIEWKCCPICECKIITNRPKGEDDGTV